MILEGDTLQKPGDSITNNIAAELSEHLLESGGLAIFCGAGISKNSGLPLADELRRRVLETLLETKQDVKQVMKVRCPFEAFLQSIFNPYMISDEDLDVARILDIFRHGEPNSNHVLIARLAKRGYLKTVVTTNFDLLIENALIKEGWREGVDFERYYREEHFSATTPEEPGEGFMLFKLHGSIDNPETVRATLAAVASRSLSEKRMHVIKHLFSSGKHTAVLVLGYSCTDTFDIIPQIQSIDASDKRVFFIEHISNLNATAASAINRKKGGNPFTDFPGKWVKCNTDALVRHLWTALEGLIGKYEVIRSEFDWSSDVGEWLGKLKNDQGVKSFIAGWVLGEIQGDSPPFSKAGDIQLSEKARSCYARALDFATAAERRMAMEFACNGEMGKIYLYKKTSGKKAMAENYRKAIGHFEEALRIAETQSLGEARLADCYHLLGISYASLTEFKTAKEYLKESRKHYRRLHNGREADGGLSGSYGEVGNILLEQQRPTEALNCYKKSFKLSNSSGDKSGLPSFCINFGVAHLRLRNFDQAIRCFQRSEKISEGKGDIYTLNVAYSHLIDAYRARRDIENSEIYKKKQRLIRTKWRGVRDFV
jgi:NAD-dependent SIR2 family protein deacetylase/Tfp pilus assembly protein PilF